MTVRKASLLLRKRRFQMAVERIHPWRMDSRMARGASKLPPPMLVKERLSLSLVFLAVAGISSAMVVFAVQDVE